MAHATTPHGKPKDVLLVADNLENQLAIRLLLERLGCRPDIVGDGMAAWEALNRQQFDFAILDLQVPQLDGISLARRVTSELATPPKLIGLIANESPTDRKLYGDAGFAELLRKPLQEADLARLLRNSVPPWPFSPEVEALWSQKNFESFIRLCGPRANSMIRSVLDDVSSHLDSFMDQAMDGETARHSHRLAGAALLIGAAGLAVALRNIEDHALRHSGELSSAIRAAKEAHAATITRCPISLSAETTPVASADPV